MDRSDSASFCSVRRGRRPHGTPRNFMHENRETSETPVVATEPQDGGRRLRPHGPRVRLRGVTLRRSTYEPFEQRQAVVGGEWGGKAAAQGEHFPIRHVPDSERDCACPMGGRVCGQATGLAAIHLREEPDALMSARPGPSGGCPVRGIPTGFDS
jgi:hypothetical protein